MPKWTERQTDAHGKWRLHDANFAHETAEDREEFFFCMDYYLNTPEAKHRFEAADRRSEQIFRIEMQQAAEVVELLLASDDATVIAALRDPKQNVMVRELLIWSNGYSRAVLDVILTEHPQFGWVVLGHPAITLDDLKLISTHSRYNEFTRGESADVLEWRLNDRQLSA
jgi:hypothetical protein